MPGSNIRGTVHRATETSYNRQLQQEESAIPKVAFLDANSTYFSVRFLRFSSVFLPLLAEVSSNVQNSDDLSPNPDFLCPLSFDPS